MTLPLTSAHLARQHELSRYSYTSKLLDRLKHVEMSLCNNERGNCDMPGGIGNQTSLNYRYWSGSGFSQWEEALQNNASIHWLRQYPVWSLNYTPTWKKQISIIFIYTSYSIYIFIHLNQCKFQLIIDISLSEMCAGSRRLKLQKKIIFGATH